MATEIATAYVSLVPSAKGIAAGIEKELGAPLAIAGKRSGASASKSFAGSFKSGLGTLAKGVGGIGVLAVAAGTGLAALGEKFHDSFNTIARGTGATGKNLAGLEQSFKDVLASGAGSFDQVSQAVTTLYQRTGLTGKRLDDFASKQVTLARITKTDVGTNLQSTTQLFNLYGVAVGKQSDQLDVLFRASQIAGVTVSQLSSDMQAAAPTAKILGLGIDQTASIVAGLDKAGLPASKVMGGLASSFAKAAKAGKSPTAVIADLVAQVKKAPDATSAATLAVSKFGIGARQAAALVAGIRSGAIDLTKSLDGGKGIFATAKSTATLSGAFNHLKNVALVGLEPLATKTLGAVTKGLELITPGINAALKGFSTNLPKVINALRPIFRTATLGVRAFVSAFSGEGVTSNGFVGVMEHIGVAARNVTIFLNAHLVPAFKNVSAFFSNLDWGGTFDTVLAGIRTGIARIQVVVGQVFAFFTSHSKDFAAFGRQFSAIFKQLLPTLTATFSALSTLFKVNLAIFIGVTLIGVRILQDLWDRFGHQLLDHLRIAFNAIALVVRGALQVVQGVMEIITGILTGHWSKAWKGVLDIFAGVWKIIIGSLKLLVNEISTIIGLGMAALSSAWSFGWHLVETIAKAAIGAVAGFVAALPGRILGVVGNVLAAATALGTAILHGILHGIGAAAGAVGGFLTGIATALKNLINRVIIDPLRNFHFTIKVGHFFHHTFEPFGSLPRLAHGAVVTSPMVAEIGENARTTPEIVSPIALMAKTFREELKRGGSRTPVVFSGPINVRDERELMREIDKRERKAELLAGVG